MGIFKCLCGVHFANTVDLQYHAMDCTDQNSEAKKNKRRSSRNRRKTPKGESYSQRLLSESQSSEVNDEREKDTEIVVEEEEIKELEKSMDQLSLHSGAHSEINSGCSCRLYFW